MYELVERLGGRASAKAVIDTLGVSDSVIDSLIQNGFVRVDRDAVERDPFMSRPAPPPAGLVATPAQAAAIRALNGMKAGEIALLYGVTGSGKTFVYLEYLREVVNERKQGAVVLVPEIALTPQTVDRFRAVFGDRVAVLHSALSDGERYDAWRAIERGDKTIAVGARSAVFAPVRNLGASSWTRNTKGRTSRGRRRGTTHVTSPRCARGTPARWWCWGARRRASSRGSPRVMGGSGCSNSPSARGEAPCPRCASWTSASSARASTRRRKSARGA